MTACATSARPTSRSVDVHRAARRRDDAGDRLDEAGLAGAVRADDRRELAARHVEVDVVQHVGAAAAEREVRAP